MKHIVCYSGGTQSAEVALAVSSKYGRENTILLNHNICGRVEAPPIKKFKQQVADYIGIHITYANHPRWEEFDQFDVCVEAGSFINPNGRHALCTSRLKTEPFNLFLKSIDKKDVILYYGFDHNEEDRIIRRSQLLGTMGYVTDFPLATWKQSELVRLIDVGIEPPCTYSVFAHGNCVGCLKARKQHWYIVFCMRQDLWKKAKLAESEIGHSIGIDADRGKYIEDLEPEFSRMLEAGVRPTEKIPSAKFWREAKKRVQAKIEGQTNWDFYDADDNQKPCECSF